MCFTILVDGLDATKLSLIDSPMYTKSLLVVKGTLKAQHSEGAFSTNGLGPVPFCFTITEEINKSWLLRVIGGLGQGARRVFDPVCVISH
jgi:hypothetical protein